MKVTKREKILLIVLSVILLGFLYNKFVLIKQREKMSTLQTQKDDYAKKVSEIQAKIDSKDKKQAEIKVLNSKIIDKTSKLFPSIEQEIIIVMLDKMFENSKLQGDVVSFSEITDEKLTSEKKNVAILDNELNKLVKQYNNTGSDEKAIEKQTDNKGTENSTKENTTKENTTKENKDAGIATASKMQVTVSFKGNYLQFLGFIKEVEAFKKKIIISKINLVASEENEISGNLILDFYAIPKFNKEEYFPWKFDMPSGKENPFEGAVTSVNVTAKKKVEVKNDFVMSAKPITSDLPTIRIGKAGDNSISSYIYADNRGMEEVEFHFSKKNDKYYYKYKTSIESWPKDFNNVNEFVLASENITLEIFSQKRGIDTDLSSANVKIFNDTDRTVVVYVQNDDAVKPRVNVLKEKGNILVNR
jgi:type IV pilus assembly protein PilO